MKGIALAIETIVYVILAVTVLTVLLYFFTSTGGKAESEYQLQQQRQQFCSRYAAIDSKCDDSGYAKVQTYDNTKQQADQIIYKIVQACSGLKTFPLCGTTTVKCVQQCCLHCPIRPS